ncbi:MAG TPA: hypothetical protein PKD85_13490, partial [Saprospiraceae bacterium]|nr:hypothetical protein [Saprospiraceae bacterium]
AIGVIALLTGKTGEIITIACFGALGLYIFSMIAVIRLRTTHPEMERPFRVPFYPFTPYIALIIAVVALASMTVYNINLALIYLTIMLGSFTVYKIINARTKIRYIWKKS